MSQLNIRRAALLLLAASAAGAQAPDSLQGRRRPEVTRFYDSPTPIAVTLVANFARLRADRDTNPAWRWGALAYANAQGARDSVPVRVRPRGIWRRRSCRMPPLRVDFARATSATSIFAGLMRPKFVNVCQEDDRAEEYLVQEYQLYRVYGVLTPASYRARLLRVSYADSGTGKVRTTRHAIVTEDDAAVAARLGGRPVRIPALTPELDSATNAIAGLFQYMIGNTDWSTPGQHNVMIAQVTATNHLVAIPYDFDFSGAVGAHYATPPPILPIRSVRQRIYRGPCLPAARYEQAIAHFRDRKDAIYALYRDEVGQLLKPATVKRTLEYFDEFYAIIADPKRVKRDILDACLKDS